MELTRGGDATDRFFLAMSCWKSGDRDGARRSFDEAVARATAREPIPVELRRFWMEASQLLGMPGPPPNPGP